MKRGRCDYEGGDAGGDAKLFESKAGKSQRREFGLERTYVCNYAVPPSPGGRETCIPRVFRSVHFSGSHPKGGKSANRDKTNLGGVRSLPILPCLLSGSSCFYRIRPNNGHRRQRREWADANGIQKERQGERVRDERRAEERGRGESEGVAEEESVENSVAAN